MKKITRWAISLLLLVVLTFGAWRGFHRYKIWRSARALQLARKAIQKNDIASALLSLKVATSSDPRSTAALAEQAALFERFQNPEAMLLRRRICTLQPASPENRVAWANSAVLFRRLADAVHILEKVPVAMKTDPVIINAESRLCQNLRQWQTAKNLDSALLKRFPWRTETQLSLALNRLNHPAAPTDRALAWQTLWQLQISPSVGRTALLALFSDAMSQKRTEQMLEISARLLARSDAGLQEKMARLEALSLAHSPEVETSLADLKNSENTGDGISTLANWMNAHGRTEEVATWLAHLPSAQRRAMPVPLCEADTYARRNDWEGMRNFLQNKSWELAEPWRLALLSQAFRQLREEPKAIESWHNAVKKGEQISGSLVLLASWAREQGRSDDALEALWAVRLGDPSYPEARAQLYTYYRSRNDAENLLHLCQDALELKPDDLVAKQSVALMLFILDRDLGRAQKLAQEVYLADPKSTEALLVKACSLEAAGESAQALALFQEIPEAERAGDTCSVFYSLVLAANGRLDDARRYFAKTDPAILFREVRDKAVQAKIIASSTP